MIFDIVDRIINEISYRGTVRKQRSINRLFPDFDDKVQGVRSRGGLRLQGQDENTWYFKIHSGTKDNVWYDGVLEWLDTLDVLQEQVFNRRLWVKDKTRVDRRRLAKEVLYTANIRWFCSCPAFQYWGPSYILSLSRYDGKYGDRETRPPRIRNPRQYGAVCKHLQNLINVLPFYESDVARWLTDYYDDVIQELELAARENYGWIQAGAEELGRRQEEQEVEQETEREG